MLAKVLFLRHEGAQRLFRAGDWQTVGEAFWMKGYVEVGSSARGGIDRRCLQLRQMSTDRPIACELYQPALVDITDTYIHVRGFEPVSRKADEVAAVMQEWLLFPVLQPNE